MKELPLGKVYQLIEPGPVVMLTTAQRGRADIMTMSWHMMVDFEPPLIACVVSEADYSFAALRATRRMRDRDSGRWIGAESGEGRQYLRPRHRQVRRLRPDAAAGRAG